MSSIAPGRRPGTPWAFAMSALALVVVGLVTSTTSPLGVQAAVVVGLVVCVLVVPAFHQARAGADASPFLLVPTVLSAGQNVYLLAVAPYLSSTRLQVVIVVNVVVAVLLVAALASSGHATTPLVTVTTWLLAALTAYGVVTMALFGAEPVAAIASFRNLVTPLLFLLLGLLAAASTDVRRYAGGLVALGLATVAFGALELSVPRFWQDLGLEALWQAKNIDVASSTGLPANFYSSEELGERPIRRMVSSFADPVNFGTFLFAAFMAAWLLRRRVAMLFFVAAAAFAVSKGAFLSILIFAALWTRWYAPRGVHVLAVVAAAAGALSFYGYTITTSSGSAEAHVGGLTAAFVELPAHPLGRGLGNVGVLAGLFEDGSESEITETGLGMVMGQLGVVGLAVFVTLFTILVRSALALETRRERLFVLALVTAFLANAAFNEVAMSPNSAAPYFVMIGLTLGRPTPGPTGATTAPSRSRHTSGDTPWT